MLCLERELHEWVVIRVPGLAEPIRVQVQKITRRRIVLGFDAPMEARIDREEVDARRQA